MTGRRALINLPYITNESILKLCCLSRPPSLKVLYCGQKSLHDITHTTACKQVLFLSETFGVTEISPNKNDSTFALRLHHVCVTFVPLLWSNYRTPREGTEV